jgi:LysR family hydrogen peroxide-inducible transcriptional activator
VNLCALRKSSREGSHFEYEAGSIETLRRMVDLGDGVTIIPELATIDMTPKQLGHLRFFKAPSPMREVSLITHRNYIKHRLLKALKETIINSIPAKIKSNKKRNIVPIA